MQLLARISAEFDGLTINPILLRARIESILLESFPFANGKISVSLSVNGGSYLISAGNMFTACLLAGFYVPDANSRKSVNSDGSQSCVVPGEGVVALLASGQTIFTKCTVDPDWISINLEKVCS